LQAAKFSSVFEAGVPGGQFDADQAEYLLAVSRQGLLYAPRVLAASLFLARYSSLKQIRDRVHMKAHRAANKERAPRRGKLPIHGFTSRMKASHQSMKVRQADLLLQLQCTISEFGDNHLAYLVHLLMTIRDVADVKAL
jgi:hypothetical protein